MGEGGFGSVFKAKHIESGMNVAIKYMDVSEYSKYPINMKMVFNPKYSEICRSDRRNIQRKSNIENVKSSKYYKTLLSFSSG